MLWQPTRLIKEGMYGSIYGFHASKISLVKEEKVAKGCICVLTCYFHVLAQLMLVHTKR